MNKIIIFLISCSLLGIASSGSLFGNQEHGRYEQKLQENHMISLSQMSQQDLMRQKYVLDILFNIQDRLQNMEQFMREYDIMNIKEIQSEMCIGEMDLEMLEMMELCNKCMGDTYSLSYAEELRQFMGLYRLFMVARDFETLQQMSLLARKCLNGRLFALSFMIAIRDRQDTQMIIIPKMYEIMPEMYYTQADMEQMHQYQSKQEVIPINMQTGPQGYFDRSYLWMPYREMRRQIMLQKMRGRMGYMPIKRDQNIVTLDNRMQHMDDLELFIGDLDFRAYMDGMVGHMMKLMGQDVELKNEQEMRMRGFTQENNMYKQGMGVSDSVSHMNKMKSRKHDLYNIDREYQHVMKKDQMYMQGNHELPTRNINDERLLHVGRRHRDYFMNQASYRPHNIMSQRAGIREAHLVVDAGDPRGLEVLDAHNEYHSKNKYNKHPYSYYLQQQFNKMDAQIQTGSPERMYEMRHKRSAELNDQKMYQSVSILLHNIRQLMVRIRMERMSMGEQQSRMHDVDLDRMRAIRLNKMGLDTRQARLVLDHFNEMERLINNEIVYEMKIQKESGHESMNIARVILNIFTGRIKGVSVMKMLDDLQQVTMKQNEGKFSTQMYMLKRRIYVAVMTHFLSRMDNLMSMYQQNYEEVRDINDVMMPGVTISELKVDRLRTFVDNREDDLVNMMHCKNMKSCLDEGKVMYARQPRLNHKSFMMRMQMASDRSQDVIIRIFLAPKMNADFMLMDTRVLNLQQGKNYIKFKSNDIMWTMKDTTSYSQLYQYVMLAMQNQYEPEMQNISKQQCRFPHHLLLPRGHIDGLPMKLIVVVSPMNDAHIYSEHNTMMCAMGIENIGIDQHFYDFRLNRYIKDESDMDLLINMPNIQAEDVMIYHE